MPLEPVETLPLEGSDTQQLVFIDSDVQDSQTLVDNISGAAEVIVLDSDTDELVQISERLSDYEDLDAVHIVSHGEAGQLTFGNTTLNSNTLPDYQEVLEDWSLALDADADLLLYACDTASGEQGNAFIQQVSEITGADVAASVDDTGIDGNWELEATVGDIEANSAFNEAVSSAYQHTLNDFGNITLTPGNFDFGGFDTNTLDFNTVSANDLTIFAEAGFDFDNIEPSAFDNVDFSDFSAEELEILQDAGIAVEPFNLDNLSETNLEVLANQNYLEGIELSSINSLTGETTFAELSDSITANANLFDYKNPSLEVDSELSIEQLSEFTQSDLKALDYAFTGDEAFDGVYYLEQNPEVAEAGTNPFTHYVETGRDAGNAPNEVFKNFQDSDTTLIVGAKADSKQISLVKDDGSSLEFESLPEAASFLESEGQDIAAVPIAIYYLFNAVVITGATLGSLKAANNIQELIQGSDDFDYYVSTPPFVGPLLEDDTIQGFPSGEGEVSLTTPPFDLGEATQIDPKTFPQGEDFLQDVLDGQFEFPDAEESGVDFLAANRDVLIGELADAGIKHNSEDIIEIDKTPGGKIIFLETGNSKAGLEHIKIRHGDQFADRGIAESEIPGVVIDAVVNGKIVGYQGSGTGRPIYETTINGKTERLAVTVGSNGFVVGANFQSLK